MKLGVRSLVWFATAKDSSEGAGNYNLELALELVVTDEAKLFEIWEANPLRLGAWLAGGSSPALRAGEWSSSKGSSVAPELFRKLAHDIEASSANRSLLSSHPSLLHHRRLRCLRFVADIASDSVLLFSLRFQNPFECFCRCDFESVIGEEDDVGEEVKGSGEGSEQAEEAN
ncbi:hypothetical protein Droror1_Dr00015963 [Drosera rotundifolia]